jgi:hypothetical protein
MAETNTAVAGPVLAKEITIAANFPYRSRLQALAACDARNMNIGEPLG